jgi:3-hydroxyacyl-CoA dehydrogenase / 3-hydroxy-2-methylbutyryl-CoA dehydrogenase
MELADAVAVVTGGASGMGLAITDVIAAAGGRVAVLDLPGSRGAEIAKELGDAVRFFPVDVADEQVVAGAFEEIAAAMGPVNVVLNVAGVPGVLRRYVRGADDIFPMDVFRSVVAVNLLGVANVMRYGVASMLRGEPLPGGERGVIINVSSISALEGTVGQVAYSASKGGVVAMTLPLARELGPYGIRVNTICPGSFDTGMMPESPAAREYLVNEHLFPERLGYPSEFAHLARAVIENPMLNGETIRLDAGARLSWRRK